jgi:hypothetical protein
MRPSSGAEAVDPRLWGLVLILVVAATVAPVAAVRFVPLNDYPFHLARVVILAGLEGSGFDRFYEPGHWLLPNIAMDAFVLSLAGWLSPEIAARLFVGFTLVVQILGVAALHAAAHGRRALWPLVSAVVLFHGFFAYGFLNYLFGVGLAFLAAAGWMRWRDAPWVLPLGFAVSVLLMLCHMAAFGLFAVLVACIELEASWRHAHAGTVRTARLVASGRRLMVQLSPLLAALLLFLVISPTRDDILAGFANYPGYLPGKLLWRPLLSLASPTVELDVIFALGALGVVGWAWWSGRLRISAPLGWAVAALFLCVLLLPKAALGSDFADTRLVPVALLVAIAAVDIRDPRRAGAAAARVHALVALAVLALVGARATAQTATWVAWERELRAIVQDFAAVEPGSIVFAVIVGPSPRLAPGSQAATPAWRPSVKHVASYASLHADVFVPMTFVDPHKQPLRIAARYRALKTFQGNNPLRADTAGELADVIPAIDAARRAGGHAAAAYVSVVGAVGPLELGPPPGTAVVARGERHMLLRLPPTPPGSPAAADPERGALHR